MSGRCSSSTNARASTCSQPSRDGSPSSGSRAAIAPIAGQRSMIALMRILDLRGKRSTVASPSVMTNLHSHPSWSPLLGSGKRTTDLSNKTADCQPCGKPRKNAKAALRRLFSGSFEGLTHVDELLPLRLHLDQLGHEGLVAALGLGGLMPRFEKRALVVADLAVDLHELAQEIGLLTLLLMVLLDALRHPLLHLGADGLLVLARFRERTQIRAAAGFGEQRLVREGDKVLDLRLAARIGLVGRIAERVDEHRETVDRLFFLDGLVRDGGHDLRLGVGHAVLVGKFVRGELTRLLERLVYLLGDLGVGRAVIEDQFR